MIVAAIDVGSNSIHMVVVRADGQGGLEVLAREKAMVRLARGQALSGEIGEEAFQAGLQALAKMADVLRSHGCETVMACGTAALRDARNAPAFIQAARDLGIDIKVISGEEEARLIYRAVEHAVPFPATTVALMDIGGGSTELTWVEGGIVLASVSIPYGIQRLTDLSGAQDPPTEADHARLQTEIARILQQVHTTLPVEVPPASLVLATSGTLEDLAWAATRSASLSLAQLDELNGNLWAMPAPDRTALLGVNPKRAEMIHVGGVWAAHLMRWLGASELHHLPVGLREGMIWEAVAHGGRSVPPLAERRMGSVQALAAVHAASGDTSPRVESLAMALFEDLHSAFELGDWEREMLRMACLLHRIGQSQATRGYHKAGATLILTGELKGFWPKEVEVLALLVRFHRGRLPDPERHEAFRRLAPWHRALVEKLASILRIATVLDSEGPKGLLGIRLHTLAEEALLELVLTRRSKGLPAALDRAEAASSHLAHVLRKPVRLTTTFQSEASASNDLPAAEVAP